MSRRRIIVPRIEAKLFAFANSFQPTIILWLRPTAFPVTSELVARLRSLGSSPTIVLQERDACGIVQNRLTPNARLLAKEADLVYLSGTGSLARVFRRAGVARIRYAFDGFDSERFGTPWSPTTQREYDVVMIARGGFRERSAGCVASGATCRIARAPVRPVLCLVRPRLGRPSQLEWPARVRRPGRGQPFCSAERDVGPLPGVCELHLQQGADLAREWRPTRHQLPSWVEADIPTWFRALLGQDGALRRRDSCCRARHAQEGSAGDRRARGVLCTRPPFPRSSHGAPGRGRIGVPVVHCSGRGVNEEPLLGLKETDGLDPTEAVLTLADRTIPGQFWTYGSVALTVVLQDGYTLSVYFADMGISSAVVQKPELDLRSYLCRLPRRATTGGG